MQHAPSIRGNYQLSDPAPPSIVFHPLGMGSIVPFASS